MPLYKTNGIVMDHLFSEHAVVVYITYTMATYDLPDIYALARGITITKGSVDTTKALVDSLYSRKFLKV